MGTLAGLANRLLAQNGGVLQIAESGERNRHSLEDLGLDFLMEIDPSEAKWQGALETIRAELKPPQNPSQLGTIQKTALVLEAHQTLSDTNAKNLHAFSNVVNLLESELNSKQKLAEDPEQK